MIPFNKTPKVGTEEEYVVNAINRGALAGDGIYSKKCQDWFANYFGTDAVFLTPNCTQALEMSALLIDIQPGDEVIMPSYTFVSTANAFVLRGAKVVFVDIRPDTMNIDENKIEAAITDKTKAVVVVHYAGVACEMDTIVSICQKHKLTLVEDAAQALMSKYKGKKLGTFGDFSAVSFHDTKNYSSGGEGGLLVVNNEEYKIRAEIIREKGTNRNLFFRGMVDKYTWVDLGSSFLPSELQAAYLYAQLEQSEKINANRLANWNLYHQLLIEVNDKIELPTVPDQCEHNAHMYYVKAKNLDERSRLIEFLANNGVKSVFHYIPMHNTTAGEKFSIFHGNDEYTTKESERLIRLPMWYDLPSEDVSYVVSKIKEFYSLGNEAN